MSTCDTDRITWIISVFLSNMFARTHQMLCICLRGTRLCSEVRGPQHPKVINTLLCPAYLTPQCHVEMGWMRQEVQRSEALKRETEAKAASEELTSVDRSKPFTTGFINCLVFFLFFVFVFAYMGCQPSHWRTHIFQRGRSTTRQSSLEYPLVIGQINGIIIGNMRIFTGRLWRC